MREHVEMVLKNLINEYGIDICRHRVKLLGLLLDLCSESEREVRILLKVLNTGIMINIINCDEKDIGHETYTELVNKLSDNLKLDKESIVWAIETWFKAIDFKYESIFFQDIKPDNVLEEGKKEVAPTRTPKKIKHKLVYVIMIIIVLSGAYFFVNHQKKNENLSINVGNYIQLGTYNSKPILWRVINKDINGYMLFSENIICFKAFDASGDGAEGREDSDRLGFGSNFWEKSNLREWLNSCDKEVKYSQQPPDKAHVLYNPYSGQPGFLYGFTNKERDSIGEVNHKCILASIDKYVADGGTETYEYDSKIENCVKNYDSSYYKNSTDKVFLLSTRELKKFVYDRGWRYQRTLVDSDNDISWYWLRTPFVVYSDIVRAVGQDGVYSDDAYNGLGGVVPALYLKSKITPISGKGSKEDPYTTTK